MYTYITLTLEESSQKLLAASVIFEALFKVSSSCFGDLFSPNLVTLCHDQERFKLGLESIHT
jgi:hypothetical protein